MRFGAHVPTRGRLSRAILAEQTVRGLPILIETPGDEPEDLRNLATLRAPGLV